MKISWFSQIISPEIGAYLAGYSNKDKSVAKLDDLFATGLCLDDGETKVVMISFDLLGLDAEFIQRLRRQCGEILGVPESAVLCTCTHTHTGPESRYNLGSREHFNLEYLAKLEGLILDAVKNLPPFKECNVNFYSKNCDANTNRHFLTRDNCGSFLPHRREMRQLAEEGIADKELGCLFFMDAATGDPLYVIGNYAAHPLAGHAPGLGGRRISADYPGAFRRKITENTGADAMFVSGAAGDLVPIDDELGKDAIEQMGTILSKNTIDGLIDSMRNPARFRMKDVKLGSCLKTFTVPLRNCVINNPDRLPPEFRGSNEVTLEIQCVSIGDTCFVGVPGELCNELGLEIKWHSPFRKAWIAYCSTAYFSYLCPGNFLVSGGYEPGAQRITARSGLKLVSTAVDAMYELREKVYPSQGDEKYPDCLELPLVNIPPNR